MTPSYIEIRKTLWEQSETEILFAQDLETASLRYEALAKATKREADEHRQRADMFKKAAEAVGEIESHDLPT